MKEAYCSEKVSELLKKKRFDEPCMAFWEYELYEYSLYLAGYPMSNSELEKELVDGWSAPTHQMAMAWLREKYDLHILAYPYKADTQRKWCCQVFKTYNLLGCEKYTDETLNSYNEAVETAFKFTLENLI